MVVAVVMVVRGSDHHIMCGIVVAALVVGVTSTGPTRELLLGCHWWGNIIQRTRCRCCCGGRRRSITDGSRRSGGTRHEHFGSSFTALTVIGIYHSHGSASPSRIATRFVVVLLVIAIVAAMTPMGVAGNVGFFATVVLSN